MGYTHYWYPQRDVTHAEWGNIMDAANAIIAKSGVSLALEYDETNKPPRVDGEEIRLNGPGDDGHETFFLTRKKESDFEFCKTAHKPYDVVATAILAVINDYAPGAFKMSSDGDEAAWAHGLALAARATGDEFSWPVVEIDQ